MYSSQHYDMVFVFKSHFKDEKIDSRGGEVTCPTFSCYSLSVESSSVNLHAIYKRSGDFVSVSLNYFK
jgi:hypothetical protein